MGKHKKGRSLLLEPKTDPGFSNNNKASTSSAGGPSSSTTHQGVKANSLETLSVEDLETPVERLMNKACDEASTKAFAQLWNKEVETRTSLREANFKPMYEEFEKLVSGKKLDSNLKKCTGFVPKIRQYTESKKSSIENDVKTLNLSKYLTEIAAAVTEARFKCDQIHDAVTICSWIHQRYSEFASMLVEHYKKSLPVKRFDVSPGIVSKLSVDIRMIGELIICGVVPNNDGCALLTAVLKSLVASDKEGMMCFVPISSFTIGLGDAFMGIIPRKISGLCKEFNVPLVRHDILSSDIKNSFKAFILEYFSSVSKTLVKLHMEKQTSELYNRKLLKQKGEISAERKETHLGIQSKFEKYLGTANKFSDAIDCDLPPMEELPADPEEEEEKALLRTESGEIVDTVPGIVLFEDEETRAFYQDFKDLKVYLPPVAYRESLQQTAEETQQIEAREKALNDFDDETETAELEEQDSMDDEPHVDGEGDLPPSLRNENEEKEAEAPIKPNFQDFLDKLPNCGGRITIDKAALEFAENHNTKPNRKKLVQALFRVPRQRIDLLPYYARLVAILNPVMPDVGLELCRLLKNDVLYLIRKKHQIFIETKLKIVRFIGELVNFRIFPKSDALQCLKILLMNFVHHQIEMACILVETCGRVLHRTPDSHRRMKIYVEEMMRKKTVKSLEPRYVSMIDHAYFIVMPKEEMVRIERKLSPIEKYLEPILVDNLSKETYKHALQTLKMLPWDDDTVSQVACRYLTQPWMIAHPQIQLQAHLMRDLLKAEPFVVTRMVDIVEEEIRTGLENPTVHFNHRRFSTLTFLSELYYYRLVRSDSLFDILYMLITYGVVWDLNKRTAIDPPDSLNRVRLSCYLLNENGEYLNHGRKKKRLRLYFYHLQKYLWLKRSHPVWYTKRFPFGIYETFEETVKKLYPKMKFARSFQDAEEYLCDMESRLDVDREKLGGQAPKLVPASETGDVLGFMGPLQQYELQQEESHRKANGMQPNSNNPLVNETIVEEDEDMDPYERAAVRNRAKPRQNHSPEDEEFIAMFDKMCSEVAYTGKQMKTEITIPLQISNSTHATSESKPPDIFGGVFGGGDQDVQPTLPPDTVPFTLMTRKGNKQQFRTLALPAESEFVQRIRDREELERQEKENVKKRTLAISQLQDAEERQREVETLKATLITPATRNPSVVPKQKDNTAGGDAGFYSLEDEYGPKIALANRKKFHKWTHNKSNRGRKPVVDPHAEDDDNANKRTGRRH